MIVMVVQFECSSSCYVRQAEITINNLMLAVTCPMGCVRSLSNITKETAKALLLHFDLGVGYGLQSVAEQYLQSAELSCLVQISITCHSLPNHAHNPCW